MTKTFIRITNEEIYKKIEGIERKIDSDVAARLARLDRRVSIAMWTSGTALTLTLIIIGVLLKI